MGLIADITPVYRFLKDLFDCLPVAVQLLIYCSFGGVIYISVMRGIRG